MVRRQWPRRSPGVVRCWILRCASAIPPRPGSAFRTPTRLYTHLQAVRARVSQRSYVVVATQGAYDEEALEAVIETPARYIGLVASGKRAATILQYLRDKGVQPERLQGVKCPAGLQLGAVTPPEIAFSIMAEILELRRRTMDHAAGQAGAAMPAADGHAGHESCGPRVWDDRPGHWREIYVGV